MNKNLVHTALLAALRRFAGIAAAVVIAFVPAAFAATPTPKVSADLQRVVDGAGIAGLNWARDTSAGRMVKVLVIAQPGVDPDLTPLRGAIVAAGGSIYYRYISVNGVLALLPLARVADIAARQDVGSLSPNRLTARTQSLLEKATGVGEVRGTGSALDVDGSGVGIAFLDSGIMSSHAAFLNSSASASRVKKSIDVTRANESSLGSLDWKGGYDFSKSIYPGSSTLAALESAIDSAGASFADPYGHGTLVASIAAGRNVAGAPMDNGGIAPGARLYDVRVLNASGLGDVADALAGIDWVLYHAKEYNIRVLNVSLAADSTESYLTDPLCRAVRNAVAAGLTVVVAAGNYGVSADGRERFGGITSPGNEPSAITVGSANAHDTATRADDTVNFFSSRGPTRSGWLDAAGQRHPDNLLKPDLVAPGNRVVAALSTDTAGAASSRLSQAFPQLVVQRGLDKGLMVASGTSFSAPVVAGAAALLLQANPGLTPPMVKAILQYTAEALPDRNLLEQGAGLVNIAGALQLARAIAPDVGARIAAGTIVPNMPLLANDASMPAPVTFIGGRAANWSRIVYLGGDQVYSGDALFTKYQGIYDPRISWVRGRARFEVVSYFDSAKTYVSGFDETAVASRRLVTAGVRQAGNALGVSSFLASSGVFTPTSTVTNRILSGGGIVLAEGIVVGDGIVLAEGANVGDGIVLAEGIVIAEGIVVAEGIVIAEGIVVAEQGPMPGE